ncbi:hypothetical protein N658DRAFT_156989 [Parathielavia hyrcaniae]|uniref:Uncharacterized protein n=1 Tax=Parathielavia hyrcaniae TaxID=113614 RepID=A0AAN6PYW9_9PEZI|nr:hypothetical protein N658DRAFT_156989 [Parathielavia hyrcaniae]
MLIRIRSTAQNSSEMKRSDWRFGLTHRSSSVCDPCRPCRRPPDHGSRSEADDDDCTLTTSIMALIISSMSTQDAESGNSKAFNLL